MGNEYCLDSISHYGTVGMHHGVRKYQYKDGSLTPAGRERYGVGPARDKNGTPYPIEDKVLKKVQSWRQSSIFSSFSTLCSEMYFS